MLADHAGQFPAEQAHVAAEEPFIGGAGANGRTEIGGCFHFEARICPGLSKV